MPLVTCNTDAHALISVLNCGNILRSAQLCRAHSFLGASLITAVLQHVSDGGWNLIAVCDLLGEFNALKSRDSFDA